MCLSSIRNNEKFKQLRINVTGKRKLRFYFHLLTTVCILKIYVEVEVWENIIEVLSNQFKMCLDLARNEGPKIRL